MNARRLTTAWRKASLLAGGMALVLCLGLLDLWTGPELSFSVFYLLPICLVVWLLDRWAGTLLSVVSAATWLGADLAAGHVYSHPLYPYWNMVVRLSFFLTITHLLAQLKARLELEQTMARIDPLTQVSNGQHFYAVAQGEIARSRARRSALTVAYVDVDDFKHVNDRLGHRSGDGLLRVIAGTVQGSIRGADTVARVGGDEFALLLPDTGAEAAQQVLSALKSRLADEMQRRGWAITFSVGAATFVCAPESVDEMIAHADRLMYAAKSSGKDAIRHEVIPVPVGGGHIRAEADPTV